MPDETKVETASEVPEETNVETASDSPQDSDVELVEHESEEDSNDNPERSSMLDNKKYIDTPSPDDPPKEGNPIVFMDIDVGGDRLGRKYS